jgi:hypothetical protein
VACWGSDTNGIVSSAPTGIPFDSINMSHGACAIRSDNQHLECWGSTSLIGFPTYIGFTAVAVGQGGCGIRADNQELLCWSASSALQSRAPASIRFSEIDAQGSMACGLRADDGRKVCWGSKTYNPLFHEP